MRPVTRHRKRACQAEVCEDMGDRRVAQLPIGIRGCRREAGRRGLPRAGGERAHPAEQPLRSAEHTSELQSLMRISYAVFCLKKKKYIDNDTSTSLRHFIHTHQRITTSTRPTLH